MTPQRTLTLAHWGVYEVEYDAAGKAVHLHPFAKDPDPSPIGLHMLSDEVARLRVRRPAVRKSWLEHGPGAFPERRGAEPFVEVPWDEALDLVAGELARSAISATGRSSVAPMAGQAPGASITPRASCGGSSTRSAASCATSMTTALVSPSS